MKVADYTIERSEGLIEGYLKFIVKRKGAVIRYLPRVGFISRLVEELEAAQGRIAELEAEIEAIRG